jgi:GcrA cell cycle regulator
MTTQTWTPERIDQLRNCVVAGLTCSQIAAAIGVTRNSIIGKIHRLGLAPGRPPAASGRRRAAPAAPPRHTQRRALRMVRTQVLEYADALEPAAQIDGAQRCSLLELAPGSCRWPISDPGKSDFGFCGHEVIAGVSYCAGHARMAYRLPARRRA